MNLETKDDGDPTYQRPTGRFCRNRADAGRPAAREDDRGNLTLKFVDIIEENDKRRRIEGKNQTIVFWENVEGVLKDKTNAFGCFLASLAGFENEISINHIKTCESDFL